MTEDDSRAGRDGTDGPLEGRCGALKSERAGPNKNGRGNPSKWCTLPAGWGTEHVGVGTCKHHLGNSGKRDKAAQPVRGAQAVQRVVRPVEVDRQLATVQAIGRANGAGLYCDDM